MKEGTFKYIFFYGTMSFLCMASIVSIYIAIFKWELIWLQTMLIILVTTGVWFLILYATEFLEEDNGA